MNVKLGLKTAGLLPRILIRTVTINTVCYVWLFSKIDASPFGIILLSVRVSK